MYIHIYVYIYIIYITYMYITIYNHTSCAQRNELPQSYSSNNREGTLFSWLHIVYIYLAFVRFVTFVTYDLL